MSQEPEQKRAGQRGEGQPESAGAGPEGAAERPAAPERPKYTPPSYVPPVDLDKDANATEPIPNYPTRPLPRDLPPGAPPLPGTAEHASETSAGQGQQARAQQTQPQQAQAQAAGGQPGHAAAA